MRIDPCKVVPGTSFPLLVVDCAPKNTWNVTVLKFYIVCGLYYRLLADHDIVTTMMRFGWIMVNW